MYALLWLFATATLALSSQPLGVTKLAPGHMKHLMAHGFVPAASVSGFRPTAAYEEPDPDIADEEDDDDDLVKPASTQVRRPVYDDSYIENVIPVQVRPQKPLVQQGQQYPQVVRRPSIPEEYLNSKQPHVKGIKGGKGKLEDEIEEEPDRLSLLLPQSRFDCTGKNTGYYADEGLNCEVFHYCQDNFKHSWICPEGFTFHQVHLICMPPSGDNMCAKSSQFHFVNDFLYKPLNLEEYQTRPNVSLVYSDRYYPNNYYDKNRSQQEEDEEEDPRRSQNHPQQYQQQQQQQQQFQAQYQRKPIKVGLPLSQAQQQHVASSVRRPVQAQLVHQESNIGQVFRSPEEVNISLLQRRPHYISQKYREELGY